MDKAQEAIDKTTGMSMSAIMGKDVFAADEIVKCCKSPESVMGDDAMTLAKQFSLIREDGSMHEETRKSILKFGEAVGL